MSRKGTYRQAYRIDTAEQARARAIPVTNEQRAQWLAAVREMAVAADPWLRNEARRMLRRVGFDPGPELDENSGAPAALHGVKGAIISGKERAARMRARVMGSNEISYRKATAISDLPKRARPLCGAKTRRGTACQRKALDNGRCRNHGGLSTGAKTVEGRAKIGAAQRERWQAWRAANNRSEPKRKSHNIEPADPNANLGPPTETCLRDHLMPERPHAPGFGKSPLKSGTDGRISHGSTVTDGRS